MNYTWQEWLAAKQEEINEAGLAKNMRQDPFVYLQQKQGDFVYFGVHDLARFYQEQGRLPQLDIATVMQKAGQILDADHVDQAVIVKTNKDPFHYGYRKLETPEARAKRKSKTERLGSGGADVEIPVSHLQDITHMLGGGAQFSDNKLWLVIDSNTKFQQQLMREIRKKEMERGQQIDQKAQQITPQTPDVTPDQLNRAKDWLRGGDQASVEQPKMNFNKLFGEPEQPQKSIMKYKFQNREVIPTDPEEMRWKNMVRKGAAGLPQQGLDTASYDPSIQGYNIHWRSHDDTKVYEYFPE